MNAMMLRSKLVCSVYVCFWDTNLKSTQILQRVGDSSICFIYSVLAFEKMFFDDQIA